MSPQQSSDSSPAAVDSLSVMSRDANAAIDEYRYLLEAVPHIEDAPTEPDEMVLALLELATKAHMLALVGVFYAVERPLRFSELQGTLDISAKVLSQRLRELAETGLVTRRSYDENPPRVEYELTEKADELCPAFQFLYAWAAHHTL